MAERASRINSPYSRSLASPQRSSERCQRRRGLGHLVGRGHDATASVELRDASVEGLAQVGSLLLLERFTHDLGDARALTRANALFGEGLEVVR